MKEEMNSQAIERYLNILASIANSAVLKTEGMSQDSGLVKYKFGLSALKNRNVLVYIEDDNVILDMYVNVNYGYVVPEVVCSLQQKIQKEIEETTRFKVKKINVHVTGITGII